MVCFSIANIVEAIDAAGGQAEGYESHNTGPYIVPVGGVTVEKQGGKDEDVFQPLAGPYQSDDLSIHISSALGKVLMTVAHNNLWL